MIPKEVLLALDYEREKVSPGRTVDPKLRSWVKSQHGKVDPEAVYDRWRKDHGFVPGESKHYHYSLATRMKQERARERRVEMLWGMTKEYYGIDHTPKNPQLMALIRKYRKKGMTLSAIGTIVHRHPVTLRQWGIE